ncbi:MAG: hypothetical protein QOJ35_2172 [Solirubrobacteraceae bacterium]|jgi:hypothetical protein|nr:hypothetical protein [Solirubrobacteraceae bacterium]
MLQGVRLLVAIALSAGLLASCGGGSGPRGETAPPPPGALDLPARVPLKPVGAAAPAQLKVIRAWSAALRRGDVHGASALWAIPAKVQNGTPVLELSSRIDVLFFNGSLPCGSVVTSAGGARGFTITTFRLTERTGGDCAGAAGAVARTAIRVLDGKIVEWYRLPDDPNAPGLQPTAPGDDVGVI